MGYRAEGFYRKSTLCHLGGYQIAESGHGHAYLDHIEAVHEGANASRISLAVRNLHCSHAIGPDVETIRHISQTLYARPFVKWRYDAAYRTKHWSYDRMRAGVEALLGVMREENRFFLCKSKLFR